MSYVQWANQGLPQSLCVLSYQRMWKAIWLFPNYPGWEHSDTRKQNSEEKPLLPPRLFSRFFFLMHTEIGRCHYCWRWRHQLEGKLQMLLANSPWAPAVVSLPWTSRILEQLGNWHLSVRTAPLPWGPNEENTLGPKFPQKPCFHTPPQAKHSAHHDSCSPSCPPGANILAAISHLRLAGLALCLPLYCYWTSTILACNGKQLQIPGNCFLSRRKWVHMGFSEEVNYSLYVMQQMMPHWLVWHSRKLKWWHWSRLPCTTNACQGFPWTPCGEYSLAEVPLNSLSEYAMLGANIGIAGPR